MTSLRRNSYKGKWMALQSRLKGEDGESEDVSVRSILETLERSRTDVAKMSAAILTLGNAMRSTIMLMNEYSTVGILDFPKVDLISGEESSEDLVHFSSSILMSISERFGMVAEGLKFHTDIEENKNVAIGEIATKSSEVRSLTKKMTTHKGKGKEKIIDNTISVRGKTVFFEKLSPIGEGEMYSAHFGLEEAVRDKNRDSGKSGLDDNSGTLLSEKPLLENKEKRQERSLSKIPKLTKRSRSEEESRMDDQGETVMSGSGQGERKPVVRRGRLGRRNASMEKILSELKRPDQIELPKREDIDWKTVREQLSSTEQLLARGFSDIQLHQILTNESTPPTIRGTSLARKIKDIINRSRK